MKNITALKKAVKLIGGQNALARSIGTSQGHIWNWLNRRKVLPAEYVIPIEKALKGAVTRYELRPDIYPRE